MPQITLNVTAQQAQRIASCLGKAWNLKDTQDPPQPRDATLAEVKLYVVQHLRRLVNDIEGAEAQKAALAAVVVPEVEIT